MTVQSSTNRISYTGTGGGTTGPFTIPYFFLEADDLKVVKVLIADGSSVTLVLTADYSVLGAADPAGGSLTLVAALFSTHRIEIIRDPDVLQLTSYPLVDPFPSKSHERALDKLTMLAQRALELISRSLKLADSVSSGILVDLIPQASKFLRWNATATGLENADIFLGGSISVPGGVGIATYNGAGAFGNRTIIGSAFVSVVNGDGQAGNPALSVPDDAITFAKVQNIATAKLLGRTTGGSGDIEEITASDNLSLSAGLLKANRITTPHRQTALASALDAGGFSSFITIGSGLRPGIDASPTPLVLTCAKGYDQYGAVDLCELFNADITDPLGADLPGLNTSFLFRALATAWGATILPPQYRYTFDRTRQILCRFPGTDGAAATTEDYGNALTFNGNAQLDTAVQIDGLNTLLLDGTGDFVDIIGITTLGDGSWTLEGKFRSNTLPTSGLRQTIFGFTNGTDPATRTVSLRLFNDVGTITTEFFASSNNTSHDIANNVKGVKTSWAVATTYHFVVAFDALASKYLVYVDGIQDISVSSTLRIAAGDRFRIGRDVTATPQEWNGAVAGFRFSPACRYPNGTTFTPPNISTFAVEGHFFSIPQMKMLEATGASVAAGTDPTFTQRDRMFIGEADTSGAAVTAVRSYGLLARYVSELFSLTALTTAVKNHNLGIVPLRMRLLGVCQTTDRGYVSGDTLSLNFTDTSSEGTARGFQLGADRMSLNVANASALLLLAKNSASQTALTPANWKFRAEVSRGW